MDKLDLRVTLKDAPKGMKLYSTIFGECRFQWIEKENVVCRDPFDQLWEFRTDGKLKEGGECVLFPSKDKRDWEGFKVNPSLSDIVDKYVRESLYSGTGLCIDHPTFRNFNEKAKAVISMIAVAEYLNDGWTADWLSEWQEKYYLYADCLGNIQTQKASHAWRHSICYFKDEETAKRAMAILGQENIMRVMA